MRAFGEIDKLNHIDQLIEMLGDLLNPSVITTSRYRQSRKRLIFRRRHCERINVVVTLRKQADNARKSPRFILEKY